MDIKSSSPTPIAVNKSKLGIHSTLSPPLGKTTSTTGSRKYVASTTLDDVRSNGWLDAMKASSPPRNKLQLLKGSINALHSTSLDYDNHHYDSFKLDYPSALDSFEKIIDRAKNKKVAVFLDYDGTLSPIVADPDCAFMSEAMRTTVRSVANYFPTAIISGRSRDKVFDLVKLTELYYAGSHGMDIISPSGQSQTLSNSHRNCVKYSTDHQGKGIIIFQPAREFLPMIDEVYGRLVEITKDIKGAKVENHRFCVSVHYRNVQENNWTAIAQRVHDMLKNYPRFCSTHGRKVIEIRPMVDWNKGKAVEFLIESLGLNEGDGVLPIYIGDDKTDEDAFKVLRESNRGCGILVSSVKKESNASYSLRDPTEVMRFLQLVLDWKRQQES